MPLENGQQYINNRTKELVLVFDINKPMVTFFGPDKPTLRRTTEIRSFLDDYSLVTSPSSPPPAPAQPKYTYEDAWHDLQAAVDGDQAPDDWVSFIKALNAKIAQ